MNYFKNRSGVHLHTVPSWNNDTIFDEILPSMDSVESLDDIKNLIESGIKGPNLYTVLSTISNSSKKVKIPSTLIKVPHHPSVYFYNDEKGFVKSKSDAK